MGIAEADPDEGLIVDGEDEEEDGGSLGQVNYEEFRSCLAICDSYLPGA